MARLRNVLDFRGDIGMITQFRLRAGSGNCCAADALDDREVEMKRLIVIFVIMMAAMLPAGMLGCNGMSNSGASGNMGGTGSSMSLGRTARPIIADIPLPRGFRLDERRSRDVSAAGQRWIDHVYTGSADKFAVREFYLTEMPQYRWTLVTKSFIQGQVTLDYRKDAETCRVIVEDMSGLFGRISIKVFILTSGPIREPAGAKVE